jgi:uncharacterized protein (PEP-CTERM system associated)
MSPVCRLNFRRFALSSAAFVLFAGSGVAHAQTPPRQEQTRDNTSPAGPANSASVAQLTPAPASSPTSQTPPTISGARTNSPANPAPIAPEFQFNARALFSESYVTNASGYPGASRQDYLSTLGFDSDLHEHSRRISLDATYDFFADFYARGTYPTQINNNLLALGNVDVIPEYLDLNLRAFASPVVTSNFGALTAGDRVIPGAYSNSYGYFATPDLKFRLGNFATSQTMPSYGQVFFTTPPGTPAANINPNFFAIPTDTTLRSLTEQISSGTDFERLNWKLTGVFSETVQPHNLLSEKAGIADARYALNYEWSILATAGYDAVTNTIPLTQKITGPVLLGGIGLTLGKDFSFEAEAGERYKHLSIVGNLRYELSPSSLITASANDFVETPEGQLLNNLTGLTALSNGTLASANDVLGNGTISPLSSFNVQSPDYTALTNFVSRFQTASASLIEDFGRTHATITLFGVRQTYLSPGFTGPATANSWSALLLVSRNITPLLTGTLGGGYLYNQEFGAHVSTITAEGELDYSLSRATHIFLRSYYTDRLSSNSLLAVSPFGGNTADFRATLGISHDL